MWATVHQVDGRADRARRSVPVGRPIDNTRCYVLDPPRSARSRTACRGSCSSAVAGVARGYVNRPELTAERFVPDPFVGVPGARMYRTGDLARLLADGDARRCWAGRTTRSRSAVTASSWPRSSTRWPSHPAVRAAVVTTWEAGPRDVRLAAYYIPRRGGAVDADELRGHLRGILPAYMIPAAYVPWTPSRSPRARRSPATSFRRPRPRTTARTPSAVGPTTPLAGRARPASGRRPRPDRHRHRRRLLRPRRPQPARHPRSSRRWSARPAGACRCPRSSRRRRSRSWPCATSSRGPPTSRSTTSGRR